MELISRFVIAILAYLCMGHSLQKLFPPQPKRWKRLMLYCLLYATFAMPSWVGDENPILMFPVFMLGFFLLLQGEWLSRLVIGAIFYTLFIATNMLFDSLYQNDLVMLLLLITKMLFWCALAWFLWRIVPTGGLQLSQKLWLLLGGLALAPLVAVLSFSIWGNHFLVEEQYRFYHAILQRFGFTILPFVLISALTLLVAAVVLTRHEALEHENKLAALREVYYAAVKQEQTQLRTLRHDLHNHVMVMQGLLEQDKQKETIAYLSELSNSPALESRKRYTANEVANVVLASKATQIEVLGLLADFEVVLPTMISLPAPELCALLGNALDNAIEGIGDAKDKTITLRARLEKGVFMLQVQNAVGGIIKDDLSTTKEDTSRHGFGLAGMREIAHRYGGSLEAVTKDGRFMLLVCFPCKEL